jgi:hypothetical protein
MKSCITLVHKWLTGPPQTLQYELFPPRLTCVDTVLQLVSLFTHGYIAKMLTPERAGQYFGSLLQFDERYLQYNTVYGTIVHFAAQNAQPFTYMDKLSQPVWVLDYTSHGKGAVVPQSIDVQSGQRNALLNMPIFFLNNRGILGLRLNEAVLGIPNGLLLNGDYAPALVRDCNTITICIDVSVSQVAHVVAIVRMMSLLVAWLQQMDSQSRNFNGWNLPQKIGRTRRNCGMGIHRSEAVIILLAYSFRLRSE